jgi:hypothetical protein
MDIPGADDDMLEQLLQGLASGERAGTSLESLVASLRRDLEPLVEGPAPSLLDAMGAAATAPGDELAARRSRRVAIRAVIVAATIGLGATGAAAVAGDLPDAVQDFVHDVADSLGIDIPAGEPAVPGAPDDAPGQGGEIPGKGIGPDGVPPGQGGEIPGEGIGPDGVPPGEGGEIPGDGVGPDGVPPGQGGETPGQGDPPEVDPPGQGGENPSDTAPGVTAPGATAPGATAPVTTAPTGGQGSGGQGGQSGRSDR